MSSNEELAAEIAAHVAESVRQFADLNTVYRRLRYFLAAAIVSFLTLATLVMFNYRQSLRAAEVPALNTHVLCSSLAAMADALPDHGELPGECTDKVLSDHTTHPDD